MDKQTSPAILHKDEDEDESEDRKEKLDEYDVVNDIPDSNDDLSNSERLTFKVGSQGFSGDGFPRFPMLPRVQCHHQGPVPHHHIHWYRRMNIVLNQIQLPIMLRCSVKLYTSPLVLCLIKKNKRNIFRHLQVVL